MMIKKQQKIQEMKTADSSIILICFKIMMLKHLTDSFLTVIESFKITILKHLSDSSFTAIKTLKFSVAASSVKSFIISLISVVTSSITVISHKRKESETSSMISIKQMKIFV